MIKQIICSTVLLFLPGCHSADQVQTLADPVPDQFLPAQSEGISLELMEDDFAGSPISIKTLVRNSTVQPVDVGRFYHIELYKQGQWHIITYSDAVFLRNPHFRDGGIPLGAHREIVQEFSVEDLGITLYPGQYRLVKTILQRDPYHEVTVAVPFTVN